MKKWNDVVPMVKIEWANGGTVMLRNIGMENPTSLRTVP
jgi:hypothetical protein